MIGTTPRRERLALAAGVVLCLLGAGAGALLGAGAAALQQPARSSPAEPVPENAPAVGTVPAGVVAPVRLSIPAAHVDAPVERVGLTLADNVDVPKTPTATGWYDLGPSPGQAGDAVIVGHLDTGEGDAVFADLHRLRSGDGISVTLADGTPVRFTVRDLTYYPYDSPPPEMYATSGPPRLSLVTCAGRWDARLHTYLERLVVSATRTG